MEQPPTTAFTSGLDGVGAGDGCDARVVPSSKSTLGSVPRRSAGPLVCPWAGQRLNVGERDEQCFVSLRAKLLVGTCFKQVECLANSRNQRKAPRGECEDAGAPIAAGGPTAEVPHGLQFVEQRVESLFAQSHVLGELGGCLAFGSGETEQVEVGLAEVGESLFPEVIENETVAGFGGSAQLGSQHGAAWAGVAVWSFHRSYRTLDDYRQVGFTTWSDFRPQNLEPR